VEQAGKMVHGRNRPSGSRSCPWVEASEVGLGEEHYVEQQPAVAGTIAAEEPEVELGSLDTAEELKASAVLVRIGIAALTAVGIRSVVARAEVLVAGNPYTGAAALELVAAAAVVGHIRSAVAGCSQSAGAAGDAAGAAAREILCTGSAMEAARRIPWAAAGRRTAD
jgi:hypothetical protein